MTSRDARSSGPPATTDRRVQVLHSGSLVPIISSIPVLSSAETAWKGVALEVHNAPACDHPDHWHPTHFLQLQLKGPTKFHWTTEGVTRSGVAGPGTLFVCPRGSRDRVQWDGPTSRVMVSLDQHLLAQALEEKSENEEIELLQKFDIRDRHVASLMLALQADLEDSSPAGRLYGESLITALVVYLQKQYAVFRPKIAEYRGGMPATRLNRVIEYIRQNLGEDIKLSTLAGVAGMGPHYFCELFKQSTGLSPHRFVIRQRIEQAKEYLRDPKMNMIEVSAITGFVDQSHFSKVFRRVVGASPTEFRASLIDHRVKQSAVTPARLRAPFAQQGEHE